MTPAIEPITQLRLLLEQLQSLISESICWKESAGLQMPQHSFPFPLLQIVPWTFSSIKFGDFCIGYLDRSLSLSLERVRGHMRHLSKIAKNLFYLVLEKVNGVPDLCWLP